MNKEESFGRAREFCPLFLRLFQVPFGDWKTVEIPGTKTSYVIEPLRPGLQYEAELSMTNSVGPVKKNFVFSTQPTALKTDGFLRSGPDHLASSSSQHNVAQQQMQQQQPQQNLSGLLRPSLPPYHSASLMMNPYFLDTTQPLFSPYPAHRHPSSPVERTQRGVREEEGEEEEEDFFSLQGAEKKEGVKRRIVVEGSSEGEKEQAAGRAAKICRFRVEETYRSSSAAAAMYNSVTSNTAARAATEATAANVAGSASSTLVGPKSQVAVERSGSKDGGAGMSNSGGGFDGGNGGGFDGFDGGSGGFDGGGFALADSREAEERESVSSGNESSSRTRFTMHCEVCGDKSTGPHHSISACDGCSAFFVRCIKSGLICKNGGNCLVNKQTRNECRYCRLKKCHEVGMQR